METTSEKRARSKSKDYPGAIWSEIVMFVEKAYGLGKQVSYEVLSNEYGLSSIATKSFRAKISTARQFGLIKTTGETITTTEDARTLLTSTNESEIHRIKVKSFSSPVLYRKLIDRFEGKALPSQASLENILMHEHDITASAKATAAKCFLQTIAELDFNKAGILNLQREQLAEQTENEENELESSTSSPSEKTAITAPTMPSLQDRLPSTHELRIPTFTPGKELRIIIPSDLSADDVEFAKMYVDNHLAQILGKYLDKYVERMDDSIQSNSKSQTI